MKAKPKVSKPTLAGLKRFLSTLTTEQLKQPVHIAFEDCPVQDLDGWEIQKQDIYMVDNDEDNIGTMRELKNINGDLKDSHLTLVTAKGTVLFY